MRKRWMSILLLAAMTAGMVMTAEAADTKIDDVVLNIQCDPEPKAGDEPGSVSVTTSSKEFTVDSAEYTNDVDTWVLGDEPVIVVELYAEDGYRFYYTSKSHFSFSGMDAELKKAKIYDGGDSMEVEISLDQLKGKLESIEGVEWSGNRARWDSMDGVAKYEVRLYRNGSTVTTVETTNRSYDFSSYMTKRGDYTFRVRGIADYNGKAGEWSEHSEENYVSDSEADRNNDSGRWMQNATGWWFQYDNGGYPSNGWHEIKNVYYYFNQSGYMVTGWLNTGGNWYYLNGDGAMLRDWQLINGRWYYLGSDGVMRTGWQQIGGNWYFMEASGAMLTGKQFINGQWYFLNDSGAMLTGWQQIGGQWYYMNGSGVILTGWQYINGRWYLLNPDGVMYANTWTPDGYYVDASGAYTGQRR